MLIWLFAGMGTAEACTGPIPSVVVLTEPRSEQGFWVQSTERSFDLVLEVDGVEVESELTELQDPGTFGSTFVLFEPRTPLMEGQSFRITSGATDPPEVLEGIVAGSTEIEAPSLDTVEIGDTVTSGGCLSTGKYRYVDLSLSGGEGVVLLDDERTGERMKTVFVDGETVEAYFLREGLSASAACLTPTVVLADGSQVEMDAVCSPGGHLHLGCSNVDGSGTAAWVLCGLLVRRSRR